MLLPRIGTAIVLLVLAWFAFFSITLNAFAIGIAAVTLIGAWEVAPMAGLNAKGSRIAYVAFLATLECLIYLFSDPFQLWPSLSWPHAVGFDLPLIVLAISALWWVIAIVLVLRYPALSKSWNKSPLWVLLMGILTLLPCWVGFVSIRATAYVTDFHTGSYWLLSACVIVWAADTGAYFTGRAFGKNKLAPQVSPGKTWEGVAGGLVTALLLFSFCLQGFELTNIGPGILLLTAVIGAASVFGDLFESMLKRNAGIKDSGTILPGHGGIMDRIDGLTPAIPLFALAMGWLI